MKSQLIGMSDLDRAHVHLVSKEGRIKTVHLCAHISSPLVRCDKYGRKSEGERVRAINPMLTDYALRFGYTLLKDHFDEAGMDYEVYIGYDEAAVGNAEGLPREPKEIEMPDGRMKKISVASSFPEDLLPDSVVKLRKEAKEELKWDPDVVRKAAKKKATKKKAAKKVEAAPEPEPEVLTE